MLDSLRAALHQNDNATLLLLTLAVFVLLLFIGWFVLLVYLTRQNRRIQALTRGMEGQNLEETLTAHMTKVEQTERRMDGLEQAVGVLQAQIPNCLQRVNLVRFDAFDDVGGEQSFSLGLLNQRGDGIVMTGVYSRMDVRVYAKSIQNGKTSHALSQEEERVLREMP